LFAPSPRCRRRTLEKMHIHPVHADDLELFVEAAGTPDQRREVERYLERMFAAGSMRRQWCFVAEEEGEDPPGRVAFWTLPGMEEPFALVLLDVPWDGDYMGVGKRVLGDVLEEARALDAGEIEHVLDDPPMRPQFQHHREKRVELLEGAGFAIRRETGRFEWRGEQPPTMPTRLSFRTLKEVGEDAFVDAMREVSEGTLDREIRGEREKLGERRAAREFFEDARKVKQDPAWWRLAYAPDGELIGLVMPAEPPGFLTIFYVGVVPWRRGQGYIDDLLAAGTATLLEVRVRNGKPLIADTDVANEPMAAAFERAGWARFAGRREYVIALTADRA
jgi:RimJ/RimL family protein N-acetyltransferase/predicted N-acetyltransferase YhbS